MQGTSSYYFGHRNPDQEESGFHFLDTNFDGSFLTSNELRYTPDGPLYAMTEIGDSSFGDFQMIGIGFHLDQIPIIDDHFVFLRASAQLAKGANEDQIRKTTRNIATPQTKNRDLRAGTNSDLSICIVTTYRPV